jgi:UDP-N-acetylmuramate dehydrogenase
MDDDSTVLIASAGEVWDDMVAESVTRNLWGIENLSLIPGTVGAAPFQNIGAYGRELADVFLSLLAYDIQNCDVVELGKEQCRFGYRDSLFKQKPGRYTILSVKIKLSSVYAPNLSYKPLDSLVGKQGLSPADVRYLVVETRQSKLPDWKEHSNAGSFFKNPVVTTKQGEALRVSYPEIPLHEVPGGYKVPAAWLIEHVASMKGVNHGDVGTWPMQPLVLVNYGKATADDIDTFAREIRGVIFEKTGIRLEQEVNRVG